jgi:hypothetical protein
MKEQVLALKKKKSILCREMLFMPHESAFQCKITQSVSLFQVKRYGDL